MVGRAVFVAAPDMAAIETSLSLQRKLPRRGQQQLLISKSNGDLAKSRGNNSLPICVVRLAWVDIFQNVLNLFETNSSFLKQDRKDFENWQKYDIIFGFPPLDIFVLTLG